MAELIELEEARERVILIGVSQGDGSDGAASLDELEELVKTAGAQTVGRVIQNREQAHPGTYLGKGKLEEVKALLWELEATGVVCDDELSPAQLRNMERVLDCKIMDRTMVILDIFAARANTREGKIQVELAQLKYRAVRLVGMRESLSRLGGGIGTRGPGEKKLEVDRRRIHDRIGQLKRELEEVKRHRKVQRSRRQQSGVTTVAIVGYTNAGKSTLLNALTGAEVLAEDKLFATLDPTTRELELPDGQRALLTDTVGFIQKLPHHLVEAFKSTLEEARYSDIILHVVDAAGPRMEERICVVYDTLRQLEAMGKPVITAFNKADLLEGETALRDIQADYQVRISAKTGAGLPELEELLGAMIRSQKVYLDRIYPYREAGLAGQVRRYGTVLEEEYLEEGIRIRAYVPAEYFGRLFGGEG